MSGTCRGESGVDRRQLDKIIAVAQAMAVPFEPRVLLCGPGYIAKLRKGKRLRTIHRKGRPPVYVIRMSKRKYLRVVVQRGGHPWGQ